jgi:hypothetical protein
MVLGDHVAQIQGRAILRREESNHLIMLGPLLTFSELFFLETVNERWGLVAQ